MLWLIACVCHCCRLALAALSGRPRADGGRDCRLPSCCGMACNHDFTLLHLQAAVKTDSIGQQLSAERKSALWPDCSFKPAGLPHFAAWQVGLQFLRRLLRANARNVYDMYHDGHIIVRRFRFRYWLKCLITNFVAWLSAGYV